MSLSLNKKDILIVGAGPTGLLLGCFLLRRGIPCTIIDFKSHISTDTRAVGLATSTIKLFDELDLVEKLKRKAIISSKIQIYIQGKPYMAIKNKNNNSIFSKF